MSDSSYAAMTKMENLPKDNAADGVSGGLEDYREPDRSVPHQSWLQSFAAWLSRQSLPRLIGVFLSNTHDLEIRLSDRDAEIGRLLEQLDWWRGQYVALTDSFLLSRGNKPTDPAIVAPAQSGNKSISPGFNLTIEVEADKLAEAMIFDPVGTKEKVEDLIASGRPRDKEILRRLDARLASMPMYDLPTDGVIIG